MRWASCCCSCSSSRAVGNQTIPGVNLSRGYGVPHCSMFFSAGHVDLYQKSMLSKGLLNVFCPSVLPSASFHRTAASTFKDFELASTQQRPDMVLRQQFRGLLRPEARTKDVLTKPRNNRFVTLAVMGLTVALGAAASTSSGEECPGVGP